MSTTSCVFAREHVIWKVSLESPISPINTTLRLVYAMFYSNDKNNSVLFYGNSHGQNEESISEEDLEVIERKLEKIRDAQRLTRLYGINVKAVAKSDIRFKPKRQRYEENITSRDQRCSTAKSLHSSFSSASVTNTVSAFAKMMSRASIRSEMTYEQAHEDQTTSIEKSIDRLATPKTRVPKFQDRSLEERRAMVTDIHADNYHISTEQRPWFLGRVNNPNPDGSPLAIASRYGWHGAILLTKQCSKRQDYMCSNKRNSRSSQRDSDLLYLPPADDVADFCLLNYQDKLSPHYWHNRKPGTKNSVQAQRKIESHPNIDISHDEEQDNHVESSELPSKKDGLKRCVSNHLLRSIERERQVWEKVSNEAKREHKEMAKKVRFKKAPPTVRRKTTANNKVFVLR